LATGSVFSCRLFAGFHLSQEIMLFVLIALLFVLTVAYVAAILWLRQGLSKLPLPQNFEQPLVTVLIAARNEEHNLRRCLPTVLDQDYPTDRLEVIVIDDRSSDGTADVVREMSVWHPNLRLLQIDDVDPDIAPKKRALSMGVDQASGEIILTTDADCVVTPEWVSTMVRHFEPEVGFVAGYNPYEVDPNSGLWQKILALDYFSLGCVGAAGIGQSYSLTCTGGNMGYRKAAFREVGGYWPVRHWISGDDDLLLHLISDRTDWQIRYAFEPVAHTWTRPPATFLDFFYQRIRYASKSRHYKKSMTRALMAAWVYNAMLLLALPLAAVVPAYAVAALVSVAAKAAAEITFLRRGTQILGQNGLLRYYLVAAPLHVPYVVLFGALGQFKQFRWKNEAFEARLQPERELEETQVVG
jgi:cellulose synthase/poly-beta-1,6-N-acetylglucosamine synthase-like glycosyltransferase